MHFGHRHFSKVLLGHYQGFYKLCYAQRFFPSFQQYNYLILNKQKYNYVGLKKHLNILSVGCYFAKSHLPRNFSLQKSHRKPSSNAPVRYRQC